MKKNIAILTALLMPLVAATSFASSTKSHHHSHHHAHTAAAITPAAPSADLLDVFNASLSSDPTYQQVVFQRLSTREGVPISLAALLPHLSISDSPGLTRALNRGVGSSAQGTTLERGNDLTLSLKQTVFDFGQLTTLASDKYLSHAANAQLNAATQLLIVRVASAYFTILQDQDNLAATLASRDANAKALDQATQQYKVGLKTITDVYIARAAYQSAHATYIQAQAQLANDHEALRSITGQPYPHLVDLHETFPQLRPQPANVDAWVTRAGKQNWTIKADQYLAAADRALIHKAFAGHLPTVTLEGSWEDSFSRTHNRSATYNAGGNGAGRTETTSGSLLVTLPLFEGGSVVAQTRQAQYTYQQALQKLQFDLRNQSQLTRQYYLNVVSDISLIRANREAVRSNISSLDGLEAGYRVGTTTIVDVLNQQQKLLTARESYAAARYDYVKSLLLLKQAAGTLSVQDLVAINRWLG